MKKASLLLAIILGFNGILMAQQKERKPFILGTIDAIQSAILSESRTLNIYLPEGYTANDTIKYPVIYLLDGSADEDFIHITGLVHNFSFPWINQLPKSIVVGIANVDRRRDFTYPSTVPLDKKESPTSGSSDKFIAFIEKELQPYIENNYKVSTSKTIIGQSLGGLLATEILLTKPKLFNTYIIMSPSLWWDNGSLLHKSAVTGGIASLNFDPNTKVYVGVGKEGAMPGREKLVMEDTAKKLAENLKKGKNKNLTVFFDFLPKENHATVTHQAVYNAFRLLNPVKPE